MSLASDLGKLRARSPAERLLLLETLMRLAWARAIIRLLSFGRIAALLKFVPGEDTAILAPAQSTTAERIGRTIQTAAARTPWRSACLEQALAGAIMLRRRGISGTLYLGVARDGTQPEGVAAHAWLRCGDAVVTGRGGHRQFAILGKYRWNGRFPADFDH